MSIDETFFPHNKTGIDDKIREIAEIVSKYSDKKPVLAHAFSNGGAMLYISVLKDTNANFDASIFDSAPSGWISPIASPIVIASSGDPTKLRTILRHLPNSFNSTLRSIFQTPPKPFGNFFDLRNPEINKTRPELYIYSDIDRIVNAKSVERFAEYRKSIGCLPVKQLNLRDSPHCQHYRLYPQKYEDTIESFLRDIDIVVT
jgi:hypothetical protein